MKLLEAFKGKVMVQELERGAKTLSSGIILGDDNGKLHGIRSRWAKVHAVGEGVIDIKEGDWILIQHGRWSRTIELEGVQLNLVDYPKGVLAVSDDFPTF